MIANTSRNRDMIVRRQLIRPQIVTRMQVV